MCLCSVEVPSLLSVARSPGSSLTFDSFIIFLSLYVSVVIFMAKDSIPCFKRLLAVI